MTRTHRGKRVDAGTNTARDGCRRSLARINRPVCTGPYRNTVTLRRGRVDEGCCCILLFQMSLTSTHPTKGRELSDCVVKIFPGDSQEKVTGVLIENLIETSHKVPERNLSQGTRIPDYRVRLQFTLTSESCQLISISTILIGDKVGGFGQGVLVSRLS